MRFIRQCDGWSHVDGRTGSAPPAEAPPQPPDACLLRVLAEAPCRLPSPQAAPPRSFTPGSLSLPPRSLTPAVPLPSRPSALGEAPPALPVSSGWRALCKSRAAPVHLVCL